MASVSIIQRNMQSKLILDKPGDNLDNKHLAKLIVYLINDFKTKKPYLFPERNVEGKIGPKFQNDLTEMLGLHVFATFRLQRSSAHNLQFWKTCGKVDGVVGLGMEV